MSTADSSVLTEELLPETADSTRQASEETLPQLFGEELLSDPNRAFARQTETEYVAHNGTDPQKSSTLDIRSGELILFPPPSRPTREHFRALQKWEGYVIEVREDTFLARLVPIRGEGSDQDAEIYIEEVEEADRPLIEPGAVFYWSIGYLDKPSGRLRASIIRFRRLPAWTKRELESARAKVPELRRLFEDPDAAQSTGTG